jgi:mono/diheme cytochrome c family protein
MKRILLLYLSLLAACGASLPADSARGERLFETLHCIECHKIYGRGGTSAPDLGRMMNRDFSPSSLAATMWNHAPRMWAAMRAQGISAGNLDELAAADLFAFFYAARFFEKPGDAGRGKRLFSDKRCATCHGLEDRKIPTAPAVTQWDAVSDPIGLSSALWNHAAGMRQEFARRRLAWPDLTLQDLADILVYIRNLPGTRPAPARLELTSGVAGEQLFRAKGCQDCHTGNLTLAPRLKGKTLTEIAVSMWNHAPRMGSLPQLQPGEMRELASYLWADQFFLEAGNPRAGRRVFREQKCAMCHENTSPGALLLPKPQQTFSGATMVAALWRHGPQMQEQMRARRIPWPRFEGSEMTDLIAYLGLSRTGR